MLTDPRCRDCFIRTWERQQKKYALSEDQNRQFKSYFDKLMNQGQSSISPDVQRPLHLFLRSMTGVKDPFLQEKKDCNQQAIKLSREWKPKVLKSADPFDLALRLAIAGNIMDYGANPVFDVEQTIESVITAEFAINHSDALWKAIHRAKSILYLGDNAGEIVFDKLLIETMNHSGVTFAVRGGPAINDVTLVDAQEVGMKEVAQVISNGYDVPTTILEKSDPAFRKLYDSADLIISKGQGNLEGLIEKQDPRIFFLLMVKCEVIADLVGVEKGNFIVYNTQNGKN